MTKKLFFTLLFYAIVSIAFSQNTDSYWDTKRASAETVKVKAGESLVFKSADLPIGTTEVLYRIKIIETNSKITESLVSILKSIPDPTGISQGTAGVIFLTTTITGKDKFDYALFSSVNDATAFTKTKKSTKSCFQSSESSSSDSKIINFDNPCLNYKTKNLIFVISSSNWILDQSVLIEVVPFVNKKLSRGWNEETKQEILNLAKSQSLYKSVNNQSGFSLHFKNYIEDKVSFTEYQQLLTVEKAGLIEVATQSALKKIGELNIPTQLARLDAEKAVLSENYVKAIKLYSELIFDKKLATVNDYYNLSICYLATNQLLSAQNLIAEAQTVYPNSLTMHLAMANYYLLTSDWKACKEIQEKYKNQNLDATKSWKQESNRLMQVFTLAGLENKTFKKLENLLEK
jgi:tetratricopeptide (TPR) repeat protein